MRICTIPNCGNKHHAKNLCSKHYLQKWNGNPIGRSKLDPNEFTIKGEICIISLYNKYNVKIAETIIDTDDYEKCKTRKWRIQKDKRDLRVYSCKGEPLSNFVMDFIPKKNQVVDHKYGDTLDNRKSVLQICTPHQNLTKSKLYKTNTSGYRGVIWYPNRNKWVAQIRYLNKQITIGYFENKEMATLAYNQKAKKLFGEYFSLNEVAQ